MVDHHRLIVALRRQLHLLHKALVLVDRVVELRISVRQLLAVHHQFKTLRQPGLAPVHLRQRTHLYRIIRYERRLDELPLAGLAEDLVNQLALAHVLYVLHA